MGDSYVVTGALMTCTFGMAPSSLIVNPSRTKFLSNMPRANIMDFAPMVNIMPFGMCTTPSNPTVAAATSAAMGVLTPMPCIPAITAPWMPGDMQCMVQGQPALTRNSQCICMWGGVIKFTTDGQMPGPPPVVIPPVDVSVTLPPMLSEADRSHLEPWEEQQYEQEMDAAKYAGTRDEEIADSLNRMAQKYEAEGDPAKAAKAREASVAYRESAAQKQVAAMEQVNEKYRSGGNKEAAPMEQKKDYSNEELLDIHNNALNEQTQQQQQIDTLNEQIDKKCADNMKLVDDARQKGEIKRKEELAFNDATTRRDAAFERRDAAEAQSVYWHNEEDRMRANPKADPEALQYARQQRKDADKELKAAKKEEQTANKAYVAAEKKYNAANQEYTDACLKSSAGAKEALDMMAQRNEAENTAYLAKKGLEAQATIDKHDQAVQHYNDTKKSTQEKRLEMEGYSEQQRKMQAEADAWADAGARTYINQGSELGDKMFQKSDDYQAKADEAGQKKLAAKQEWEQSKSNLKEAHSDAYGDDALFDAYTAKLELQQSMDALNNKGK